MKLIRWALPAVVGLLLFAAEGRVQAQIVYQRPYNNPYGTPAFSPYLNLLRRGTNPAVNYYGLVRPEIQTNAAIRGLQGQVDANATAIATDQQTGLPYTGHPVQFLNTTHYFFNTSGTGGAQRPGAAPQQNYLVGAASTGSAQGAGTRPAQGVGGAKKR